MNDYDLLDSDYSDEEEYSFNEDYFTTYYLDNIFDLYYQLKNTMYFNPNVMGKSSITSFTSLIIDMLFNEQNVLNKYGKTLTYRENRFVNNNKDDIDVVVDSIDNFIQYICLRYHNLHFYNKDLIHKWVVRSSCLSKL